MATYRDSEAYRIARTLMFDVCRDRGAERDERHRFGDHREALTHLIVSLAMHIVDGWTTEDGFAREEHLHRALEQSDEAAEIIRRGRADGTISASEAQALLDLQTRMRAALRRTIAPEC